MKTFFYKTPPIFIFLFFLGISFSAKAAVYPFTGTYSGTNEVPPNVSAGTGTIVGVYDDVTNMIFYRIEFSGLTTPATAAHFHAPGAPGVIAPVIIGHGPGFPAAVAGTFYGSHTLTAGQETDLFADLVYSNIHTTTFPPGELRTQIILGPASTSTLTFNETYSGSQEVPPNASTATGTISGTYDTVSNVLFYSINFSGLVSAATAAHFHASAIPGIAVGVVIGHEPGFPNATAGVFSKSEVLTAGQESSLLAGMWYSNIHNAVFPGGEIRAQIFFNEFAAPTSITCPNDTTVSTGVDSCSRSVAFNPATATGTPTPTIVYRIGTTVITSPRVFPLGTTTVIATAINGGGFLTCEFDVTVIDTQAPTITNMSADPDELWPPNHKLKDVVINYDKTDNCPGVITCVLTVTSDEPVNGFGDGNTSPDWIVIDDHNVKLRAERSGRGDGRVYTVTTTCTDQAGNSSQSSTTVAVAHDQGNVSARTMIHGTDQSPRGLSVIATPNPSRNYFTLHIETGNTTDKMNVIVSDVMGRIVESRKNLSGTQTLRIGNNLKAGIYFVELRQGNETQYMKLLKL